MVSSPIHSIMGVAAISACRLQAIQTGGTPLDLSRGPAGQNRLAFPVNERLEATVTVEQSGYYRIMFAAPAAARTARANIYVDGLAFGWRMIGPGGGTDRLPGFTLHLAAGDHALQLKSYDAEFRLERVELAPADKPRLVKPDFSPSNPDASPEVRKLLHYLSAIYGKHILTGQHTNAARAPEFEYLRRVTGKYPALVGFDLLSYSHATNTRNATPEAVAEIEGNRGSVEKAIEWHKERGGIVTLCWHWFAPTGGEDKSFYAKHTDFDLRRGVEPGTAEHEALMRDLDAIAEQLARLRDAGVPVLWRPLHEADGGWFWWGAKGPGPYKKLYRLMYDRYTNHFKLNNLIWIWNAPNPDWYPGDDVVDLVGDDIYEPGGNHGPLASAFEHAVSLTGGRKAVALTENGPIPDPDLLVQHGAAWLWYMPWWGDWCEDENVTSKDMLRRIYDHPYTLTLDDLPDWKTCPV